MTASDDMLTLLDDLITKAVRTGADAADAVCFDSVSIAHSQRLGAIEKLERSESRDLGIRVLIGHQQAFASSTDLGAEALDALVARAVTMARAVPEDPYCGLAAPERLARDVPTDLDICDPEEPALDSLIARARAAEDAARAVPGVTNSEGAEASWSRTEVALAGANGFSGHYAISRHGIGVSVLAGDGLEMESDYDYVTRVHGADLTPAEEIGRNAGEKAVRKLGPRKVGSARVPVIYDRRVAGSILGHLARAINGAAIARGTSFLKDRMNETIFPEGITIVDDPHRKRGLRSKAFDDEGVANGRRDVVTAGRLTTWLLDLRSARQLGLDSTGHAARGTSAPPAPAASNFYMAPGGESRDALIAGIDNGLYVTELIGFGVNEITGDYSRGAAGFWIEKGALAYPVNEITVAGNLNDIFANITPADDLEFRYGIDAPTLRIDGLTVAGR